MLIGLKDNHLLALGRYDSEHVILLLDEPPTEEYPNSLNIRHRTVDNFYSPKPGTGFCIAIEVDKKLTANTYNAMSLIDNDSIPIDSDGNVIVKYSNVIYVNEEDFDKLPIITSNEEEFNVFENVDTISVRAGANNILSYIRIKR